jgi:hypothetical protein
MSATLITADPNFGKSYRTTIGIEDYMSYILISNQPSIPIPTDSSGNNGVFTNATSTIQVILNNEDVTADWTVSLHQATGCTVTVSNTTKVATVSAMSADTGYFIIKAVKTGASILYTKVIVYKAKAGVDGTDGIDGEDGTGTPDDETIILNGSNQLKVRDLTYYNTVGGITSSIAFKGTIWGSGLNNNLISIGGDLGTGGGATDIISIGTNNDIGDGIGTDVDHLNKIILIGDNIGVFRNSEYDIHNMILIGYGGNAVPVIGDASNAVAIGRTPASIIPYSISLCFGNPIHSGLSGITKNYTIFYQDTGYRTDNGTVTLSIPSDNIGDGIVKVEVDLYGFDGAIQDPIVGFFKAKKSVSYLNKTRVLDLDISSEAYSSAPLVGCSWVSASSFTNTIDFTVTVTGLGSAIRTYWIANCKIDVISQ